VKQYRTHRGDPQNKKTPFADGGCDGISPHPSSISKRLANCSSAMILSPNTLSGLIPDLHQAQIAQWDHLEVPNEGGQHEAFDRVIGGADNWIRGRKH